MKNRKKELLEKGGVKNKKRETKKKKQKQKIKRFNEFLFN